MMIEIFGIPYLKKGSGIYSDEKSIDEQSLDKETKARSDRFSKETKVEAEKTGEVSLEALKKSRQIKGISASRIRQQSLRIKLPSSTKTSGESGTSTENSQTTTNVKISMKLTQSDMPSGLVNLLQVITNNIQLKNE